MEIKRNGKKSCSFKLEEAIISIKILNELYMTVRYSNNSEQREAAEGLMAKLRGSIKCRVHGLGKRYSEEFTVCPIQPGDDWRKIAEARQQSGAEKLKGMTSWHERFDPEVKHMIVFDVLSYDSPVGDKGDKMRLFPYRCRLSEILESRNGGEVKLKNHAKVSDGHLHYDRRDHAL